jgi:putative flippase GtrA
MSGNPSGSHLRIRQFARYFLTGGAAAVVDLGAFVILLSGGVGVAQAAVLSFLAALIINYFLSARFAFGRDVSARGFLVFAGFAAGGLLVNVGVTLAAFEIIAIAFVAKVIGIGVAFLFNFAMNALIVFR